MFKMKHKIASLLLAALTALVATVMAFAMLFAPAPTMAFAAESTATLSFANKAQRTSFSESKQVWAQDGITFTNDKGSSSDNVADYAKPVRLYAGSKVTVEYPTSMTNIVFDCNGTSYATALKNSIGAAATVSSDKVTVKFDPAVDSFTIAKLTAQVRLDSLTVTASENVEEECQHTNTTTTTTDATCTEDGSIVETCVDCGEVLSNTPISAGHTESDWIIDTPASEGVVGSQHKECTECGELLKTEVIPALNATKYTVSYSVLGEVVDSVEIAENQDVTMPACATTLEGYTFIGWTLTSCTNASIQPDIFVEEATYTVTSDITFLALYSKNVAKGGWTIVTDVATLAVNDQVVIVAKDFDLALSTAQNSNNRGQAEVTKSGNTVTFGDDVQKLTIQAGNEENTFAFYTGVGYLYAASSSKNYLRTEPTLSNNSSWSIAIDGEGVATVKAQGTNTRNWLRYNSNDGIFSCYTTVQKDIALYKLTAGEPASYLTQQCDHANTTTNTTDATCTEAGSTVITCNDCGVTISTETIPATGHVNKTTNTTDPTCTAAGSIVVTCDKCHVEISNTPIAKLPHTESDWIIDTPASEGVVGSQHKECTECGELLKREEIPALDAVKYTVTFSVPEGIKAIANAKVASGFTVVLPEAGDNGVYTFVGWVERETAETTECPEFKEAGSEYTVTKDVTLYALYSINMGSGNYEKVTEAPADWSGEYLIVYEAEDGKAYVFNGQDAVDGHIVCNLVDGAIVPSETLKDHAVTIASMEGGYSIHLSSGQYMYGEEGKNALHFGDTAKLNTIVYTAEDGIHITSDTSILRFNSASNQMRFRYYKAESYGNQKAIHLYKLDGFTKYLTPEKLAKINSASITVGKDIAMNYYVSIPETYENVSMRFVVDNEEHIIGGDYDEETGRYKFSLPNLAPQCMTLAIAAELISNGKTIAKMNDYSIQQYAINQLSDNPSDELKQLLTDMLHYGAAAQTYKGYKLDNLANVDVEGIGEASAAAPGEECKFSLVNSGAASYPVYFAGATVFFNNVNQIRVNLSKYDEHVRLIVEGEEVDLEDNSYYLTEGILATQFAKTYKFELYYNDELMQTLTYSVNAYAYQMSENADANMKGLALALYRYGQSAAAYNAANS